MSKSCCNSGNCAMTQQEAPLLEKNHSSDSHIDHIDHIDDLGIDMDHSQLSHRMDDGSRVCLAVVHENGLDVVIFDAAGVPRTFCYHATTSTRTRTNESSSSSNNNNNPIKLCFCSSSGSLHDDLLTPCFDQDGLHGTPDESCFCGVETPHLHAHSLDPSSCHTAKPTCHKKKGGPEQDIRFLASHILHPKDPDFAMSDDGGDSDRRMLHLPVTESLPNACNYALVNNSTNNNNHNNNRLRLRHGSRRRHRVQHDDHVDHLVHNTVTGNLHLEHPCDDCGHGDVHGRFQAAGQRHLRDRNLQLHFYEVAPQPFDLLEYVADLFEVNSDRVTAVEKIMTNTATKCCAKYSRDMTPSLLSSSSCVVSASHGSSNRTNTPPTYQPPVPALTSPAVATMVRSTLTCRNICCASEVPVVQSVLEPLAGVKTVMVNVPLRQVLVDHTVPLVRAADLESALNSQQLGASILRDGGAAIAAAVVPTTTGTATAATTTTTGRSQLFVENICCASEVPAVRSILEPLPGVTHLSINTTSKMVYVDHIPAMVSAAVLADALNAQRFGAHVRVDAQTAIALQLTRSGAFVQSALDISVSSTTTAIDGGVAAVDAAQTTETLTTFLQTFVDSSQLDTFVVDVPARMITVIHNPFCVTAQSMAEQLSERTPLDATVSMDGADPAVWKYPESLARESSSDADELEGVNEGFTYPRPTVILSGVLWIVSMLSLIGGKWEHVKWIALVSVAFGIPPIAMKAFRTLLRYQFDTNCLMFFAAVGAIALQDFTEAAAVVFLFALSEWLEVRATTRARQALSAMLQLRPEKANLVHPSTQELLLVPATAVPVGALVSVRTGDKIPCDGIVTNGQSTVDESSLTGESRPIRKGPADKVSGGTVNSGMSPLMVKTTATSENSAVSRLIRLVEEAQANRSETEKIVDRFAQLYTPVVVLAALLMCTIPWALGSEKGKEWTHNGLILIVVACPCALIISTPVSYVAGLAAAAQKGILIKGGANLEALSAVRSVCFDKTGTLTNGEFALLHMNVVGKNLSRDQVFQYLSLMEERASHPVAQAILTAANNEGVILPKKMVLQKHKILNGEGVTGVVDGKEIHVGNERLFERLNLLSAVDAQILKEVDLWKDLGGTIGYMSIEGHGIVCSYCAADGIRSESTKVLASLKRMGIKLTMLTGDNTHAAHAIGKQVGLEPAEIKAKLLPEEKLHYVKNLSSEGMSKSVLCNPFAKSNLTMMVGDGVNDAPALAAADVGVAMGEGAALSMETSDVTLLDSNLEKIEYSIRMGRRVTYKIMQNVVFSLVVKFVVLGFALTGKTELWAAIASDVGAMLLVTLNSMLLLPRQQSKARVKQMKDGIELVSARKSHQELVREATKAPTHQVTSKLLDFQEDCETGNVVLEKGKKSCSKGCCKS